MKTKFLLAISVFTLSCSNVSAQTNPIEQEDSLNAIHATLIKTNGKTIPGTVTLGVGKTGKFSCNVEHINQLHFTFNGIGRTYVNGTTLAKQYGTDQTCAVETYYTQHGSLEVTYSLTYNPLMKTYFTNPSRHTFSHF